MRLSVSGGQFCSLRPGEGKQDRGGEDTDILAQMFYFVKREFKGERINVSLIGSVCGVRIDPI
jgi:hypothetical protein